MHARVPDLPAELIAQLVAFLQRVRRLDLQPEPLWDTGDSAVSVYRPLCHIFMPCQSLEDMERLIHVIATPFSLANVSGSTARRPMV
ncbi:hypothetical protein [Desulfosoma caldarium]|uniref:hypothetical protein n=1 Tax=Desulfosoma caldarium TaxID=610254 RepID=UPI001B86C8AB|nr:hypothetical protein [Desulfosoma caldarium]